MANLALPQFKQLVLQVNPNLQDEEVNKLYEQNRNLLLQDTPQQAVSDATKIALEPVKATVEIPKAVDIPTSAPNAYKGTTQERANPTAPGAAGLSQYDIPEVQKAQAEYQARLSEMAPGRALSDYASSGMSNEGRASALQGHENFYNRAEALARGATVGALEERQKAATGGQALAGAMDTQARANAAHVGTQAEKEQDVLKKRFENVVAGLNTQQQQRLNQPDSIETQSAKTLLLSQIDSVPTADRAALGKIINQPGVTAQQLLPAMMQYAPAAAKAFMDKVSAGKTQAETAEAAANAGMTQFKAKALTGSPTYTATEPGQTIGTPAAGASTTTATDVGEKTTTAPGASTASKSQYAPQVISAAQRYGVEPDLAVRILNNETGSMKNAATAKSGKGATGVMQLMPETAADYGLKPEDLTNPEKNIEAGMQHIARLNKKYNGNQLAVAAAYNWGEGNYDKWVANGRKMDQIPTETKMYIKGITSKPVEVPPIDKSMESRFGAKPPIISPSEMSLDKGYSVSGIVEQRKQQAQNEFTALGQSIRQYDNIKPDVQFAFKNANQFGPTNALNVTEDIKKRDMVADNLNKAAIEAGLLAPSGAAGVGGAMATGAGATAGSVIGAGLGGKVGSEIGTAIGSVVGGIASAVGGGTQPITKNSHPEVVREVAAKVAMAQELKKEIKKSMQDYFEYSTGNMNNYTETAEYKRLIDPSKTLRLISPEGEPKLVDARDLKTITALRKDGWTNIENIVSSGTYRK